MRVMPSLISAAWKLIQQVKPLAGKAETSARIGAEAFSSHWNAGLRSTSPV